MKKHTNGFTLIELMIGIVIVGILALVAIPSFQTYLLKSRRSEGMTTLNSIQMAQERYRSNNTTYGTLATVWSGLTTTDSGYYTLAITNATASGYTVTATAVGNQANDTQAGTACSTLTLTANAGTFTKAPANCWMK